MPTLDSIQYSYSLSEALVGLLTMFVTVLLYVIKEQRDKIAAINSQLSDKKYSLYSNLYELLFDLYKEQMGLQTPEPKKRTETLLSIKKDLFIYAPDNVVRKFLEWHVWNCNNQVQNQIKPLMSYLEVLALVRKDMGYPKTKITEMELLRSIVSTDEEYDKLKKLIQKQIG